MPERSQWSLERREWALILLTLVVLGSAGAILWFCLAPNADRRVERAAPASNWPKTISSVAPAPPSNDVARAGQDQAPPEPAVRTIIFPASAVTRLRKPNVSQQAPLAQGHQDAEKKQREQKEAEQIRVENERRELGRQKALGRDVEVLLDQFTVVHEVGGESLRLKIHDEDVATLDVWLKHQSPVRLSKQKGITGSGTDETLIYNNSRARLYYVWEISGRLNHCRLRVRDN